ncbi:MAG: hypothetical protein KBA71_16480, partial [Opitutaceae bacterium]|nr:hypothetical protein [Opitutaceae bacterium]
PLTGFADFLRIESDVAREFGDWIESEIMEGTLFTRASRNRIRTCWTRWTTAANVLPSLLAASGRASEVAPAVEAVRLAGRVIDAALVRSSRGSRSAGWRAAQLRRVVSACAPRGHFELALERPLRLLVAAVSVKRPPVRGEATARKWRQTVLSAAGISGPVNSPVYEQWM